jgi:hypothetical protein
MALTAFASLCFQEGSTSRAFPPFGNHIQALTASHRQRCPGGLNSFFVRAHPANEEERSMFNVLIGDWLG